MGDTQQPQPTGTEATAAKAATALAEIQRRQGKVIKAVARTRLVLVGDGGRDGRYRRRPGKQRT